MGEVSAELKGASRSPSCGRGQRRRRTEAAVADPAQFLELPIGLGVLGGIFLLNSAFSLMTIIYSVCKQPGFL